MDTADSTIEPRQQGIKHMVDCQCVLPQFKDRNDPIFHSFIVFSVIDENDEVIEKYVSCNNCSALHRVFEIGKSEIVIGKDDSFVSTTLEDLQAMLPTKIGEVLARYQADLPTHEEALFVLENQLWGTKIVLRNKHDGNHVESKWIIINGKDEFKIEGVRKQVTVAIQ